MQLVSLAAHGPRGRRTALPSEVTLAIKGANQFQLRWRGNYVALRRLSQGAVGAESGWSSRLLWRSQRFGGIAGKWAEHLNIFP
jgi:hypothetical protein